MNEITIPIPDVKFRDIVLLKAKETIEKYLSFGNLSRDVIFYSDEKFFSEVNSIYITINVKSDKLFYLSELLISVGKYYKEIISKEKITSHETVILNRIGNFQYALHNEISELGFDVDANQFTTDEVIKVTNVISSTIEQLDKIAAGQEILFDRIEELKNDFKSVLDSVGLGKKPFYQRVAGITLGYLAEKGADEVYSVIMPLVKEGSINISEHIDKLIG